MLRELNNSEKNFVRKQIDRMKKEIKHLEYLERYTSLLVNEGLLYNYLEKLEEMKGNREQIVMDIKLAYEKINMLQTQMDKGVDVIEDKLPTGVG